MLASNAPQQETGDGLCLGFLATQGSGEDCCDGRRRILRALDLGKACGCCSSKVRQKALVLAPYSPARRDNLLFAHSFGWRSGTLKETAFDYVLVQPAVVPQT